MLHPPTTHDARRRPRSKGVSSSLPSECPPALPVPLWPACHPACSEVPSIHLVQERKTALRFFVYNKPYRTVCPVIKIMNLIVNVYL